jgi:hypothetical protein
MIEHTTLKYLVTAAHESSSLQGISTSNTRDFPMVRDVDFVNIRLDKVDGPLSHIGVEFTIKDYNPGHNSKDPYYGACIMSKDGQLSYYSVVGKSFPFGIFITNGDTNKCTGQDWCNGTPGDILVHNWANRLTTAILEIYSEDPLVAGARITTDKFNHFANNGVYSPEIGVVSLVANSPGAAYLNGFVTKNGENVSKDRASFAVFQEGNLAKTSSGYPVGSFNAFATNKDGYYHTGCLYPGAYKVYCTDNQTQKTQVRYLAISGPGETVNWELSEFT